MQTVSFQLYSARNFQPFAEVFRILADAGYRQVEGYSALYTSLDDAAIQRVKADLDANGLTMPTAHFGLDMLEAEPDRVIAICRTLGIEAVYCPYLTPEERPTDAAGWRALGERLQRAGEPIRAAGLTFGWHNHDFEFFTLPDGTVPQDHLFEGGPDLAWEADIAWIIRGSADPFAWIKKYGVGIIGCGNISGAYFKLIPTFRNLKLVACADINPAASKARSEEFGVPAQEIGDLLANPEVDVVVNLTIPEAHYPVSKQALEAGKHVYSEKPFVLSLEQGEDLRRIADARGLKVGSAPDTYLGGAHQFVRHLIDSGRLGKIMSGTAHVLGPGMESWHPNPDFFFAPGGGPILDMGPYYVNNLVNLVGPVKRVVALANRAREERVIGNGPRLGEKVPVVVATNIHAILEFASGAQVALMASWDVWAHRHQNMELYGTDGAVFVPDPNFFGGTVEVAGDDKEPKEVEVWDHPLTAQNFQFDWGKQANYRGIGLADMMEAVTTGRDYRCSLDRSLHTIDVLTAILRSAEEGRAIDIVTTCTQPEALGIEEARALLR